MVSSCLDLLFEKINRNSVSHIIHCSPSLVFGENGGIIGGMGRFILEKQKLDHVTYIPILGGCASLEPVIELSSALANFSEKSIVVVFSLHPSTMRKFIQKEKLLDNIYKASPYILFGDVCVAFVMNKFPEGEKSFQILQRKFVYTKEKWVAKGYFEQDFTMELNGENQKNMLKDYLLKELVNTQKEFNVEYFFVHNQVPKIFLEIIEKLQISRENAPEIVSQFGNLACATALTNLTINQEIVKNGKVIGLYSVGEHSGISESTIILKCVMKEGKNSGDGFLLERK